ncbi:MAG: hypothetical protein WD378_10230 [Egicoccus sp.]
MSRLLSLVVVVGLLVGLLGCTGDEPVPDKVPAPEPSATPTGPAGLRAGIVLPPAAGEGDPQLAQLETAMRPLQDGLPDEITQLRSVHADGPEFVGDLARLLVDRGTELVCMVGDDVMRQANQLARRHAERTFCVVPGASSELPDNVRVVDVEFEELGRVVGAAAAAAAGEGPVALVVAPDRLGAQRFRDGIRAAVGDTPLLEWVPQSADDAATALSEAVASEAEVLILDVGWQPSDLLESAQEAGLALLAPMPALAGSRFQDDTVLAWSLRWELVLGPVVARFVDEELEAAEAVGLDEDVFVFTPGGRGDAAVLERAIAAAMRPVVERPAAPSPDPDADPDDDGDASGEGA